MRSFPRLSLTSRVLACCAADHGRGRSGWTVWALALALIAGGLSGSAGLAEDTAGESSLWQRGMSSWTRSRPAPSVYRVPQSPTPDLAASSPAASDEPARAVQQQITSTAAQPAAKVAAQPRPVPLPSPVAPPDATSDVEAFNLPAPTTSAPLPTPQLRLESPESIPAGAPGVDFTAENQREPQQDQIETFIPGEVADEVADAFAADPTLTELLENGDWSETPPLEPEVLGWYEQAWTWMTEGWDNHAEFGLDGSEGNARTLAIQTGLELNRTTDRYSLDIDLDYRRATNRGKTTEDNGRLNIDFDRLVGESGWSMFGKLGLEWDEFKAFDLRLNVNSGIGYHWIRNKRSTLVSRFGAGASREFGAPVERWTPEAVFGLEARHQLNERNKLKGKIDYFPAWDDFSDFRLVSDVAWEILLDDADNLSLKLAATDRYDSTPQGAKPNDLYYSLLLLYKF